MKKIKCKHCGSKNTIRKGNVKDKQRHGCKDCKKTFRLGHKKRTDYSKITLFKWDKNHFLDDIKKVRRDEVDKTRKRLLTEKSNNPRKLTAYTEANKLWSIKLLYPTLKKKLSKKYKPFPSLPSLYRIIREKYPKPQFN